MLFYQPADGQFGDVLVAEISKNDFKRYDRLAILVAYAKHSGVSRIAQALDSFIAAQGKVVAVVGIDQRHTTIEALELLRALGVVVYVYYDEDPSRTFHPKAYWLRNEGSEQWAAIGSNNLTAGGLYLNYEIAVISTAPVDSVDGEKIAVTLCQLFDTSLPANADLLKLLDDDLLTDLKGKGYILTEQESKARQRAAKAQNPGSMQSSPIFGRSKKPPLPSVPAKFALPATPAPTGGTGTGTPAGTPTSAGVPAGTPGASSGAVIPAGTPAASAVQTGPAGGAGPAAPTGIAKAAPAVSGIVSGPTSTGASSASPPLPAGVGSPKGFWKKLSNWDVHTTSSPGQMIIPIQFMSLFPALGPSSPMPSGGTQADANFDVEYHAPAMPPKLVKGARLIAYTPAPNHPRQNVDLRFTFHDKSVDATLTAGSVLEFIRTGLKSPAFIVTLRGAPLGNKKFDVIP